MEDTADHDSSYLGFAEILSECGETHGKRHSAVRAGEKVVPGFVEALTSLASVIMGVTTFAENFVGAPQLEHAFEGRSTLVTGGLVLAKTKVWPVNEVKSSRVQFSFSLMYSRRSLSW